MLQLTTKGQVLFDAVCQRLNLIEKDYFGLCYYDNNAIKVSLLFRSSNILLGKVNIFKFLCE